MTVRIDDKAFRRRLLAAAEAGALKGGLLVAGRARKLVNVSARVPSALGLAQIRAGGKPRGKASYRYEPSKPGEPPRKRTGTLQKSITAVVETRGDDEVVARIGTNVPYGRFLEFGTRRMAARPWLRRALAENVAAAMRIAMAEIRRRMLGR